MKAREWIMFAGLGLIWGSSFLWIKVALGNDGEPVFGIAMPGAAGGFSPLLLVTMRVLFGVLGLAALMLARRLPLPREPRLIAIYAAVGFVNTALPFALITWGETRIPSGVASILNGTVPLFTLVIAHFALHDEPMTLARLAGLAVGFVGVTLLVGHEIGSGFGSVLGQAAVVAAAICYAIGAALSRRFLRGQSPVTLSFTTLSFAALFMAASVLVFDRPVHWPSHPLVWGAAMWLGLLGSCAAYVLYYSLINAWGATRASLVTYVFPMVGLILGVLVLGERLDWRIFFGTALVVGGIVIVNLQPIAAAWYARRQAPDAAAAGTGPRAARPASFRDAGR